MNKRFLEDLFKLLINNKSIPNYQAERRIDIFINYFLERILSEYLKEKVDFICPEFPLKNKDNNRSTKLDYLCKTQNEIVFVELKTDTASFKESQACLYFETSWNKCKGDLPLIKSNSNYKAKYDNLINLVNSVSFLSEPTIKVIYIAPLKDIEQSPFKEINVTTRVSLSDLKIELSSDEIIAWEFIKTLDLNIFEIKKKINKKNN